MINRQLTNRYEEINWNRILRTDLGAAGQLTSAQPIFNRIKKVFDSLLKNSTTFSLSESATQQIEYQLTSFLQFIESSILNFSDVSLRDSKIQEIKSKEWEIINSLGSILHYLLFQDERPNTNETSIVLEDIKKEWGTEKEEMNLLKKNIPIVFDKLETSIALANKLQDNSSVIDTAIERANEWIKKNKETVDLIISNNASDAAQKANEHITYKLKWVSIWIFKKIKYLNRIKQPSFHGSFVWIMSSMFFGTIVMGIIGYFVISKESLTVGMAILRISAILVPSYFTIFCAQQFLAHRKLYESYRFKDISLKTMIDLKGQISDNERESQILIVKKGLDVLFSEPVFREEKKYDKQVILQLIEMLKRQ